ncbi:Polyamine transporter 1 [Colletotrichum chlorophyti]|uniref:Polyamine transporter 1 n=1 Tax=Colletotrichum chlorophyti TaxID=708187 RepID=A0A1Q8RQJ0_9PEZI|nr:Polyamine transporter 1 [Colletotrichum chlorophyti]
MLFFTIRESRPSVALAHSSALPDAQTPTSEKVSSWHLPSLHEKLDIVRPLRLLFTEPIVFLVALISAIAFGLVYLFTEILPLVYDALGFDNGWQNIPFLALGVGMILSILTRFYDRQYSWSNALSNLYERVKADYEKHGQPSRWWKRPDEVTNVVLDQLNCDRKMWLQAVIEEKEMRTYAEIFRLLITWAAQSFIYFGDSPRWSSIIVLVAIGGWVN